MYQGARFYEQDYMKLWWLSKMSTFVHGAYGYEQSCRLQMVWIKVSSRHDTSRAMCWHPFQVHLWPYMPHLWHFIWHPFTINICILTSKGALETLIPWLSDSQDFLKKNLHTSCIPPTHTHTYTGYYTHTVYIKGWWCFEKRTNQESTMPFLIFRCSSISCFQVVSNQ